MMIPFSFKKNNIIMTIIIENKIKLFSKIKIKTKLTLKKIQSSMFKYHFYFLFILKFFVNHFYSFANLFGAMLSFKSLLIIFSFFT